LLATFLLVALPTAAFADGSWLDGDMPKQMPAGPSVPKAPALPAGAALDARCVDHARPPETPQDQQTVAANWMLTGDYRGGWGLKTVTGATYFDGMCRPMGYQVFVFADEEYVGAVSPTPMDSRTDGAAVQTVLQGPDRLSVVFARYADTDPLCCPSRTSSPSYLIDRSGAEPVLIVTSVLTTPTGGG
jgi:hypothetical protein